MYINQGKIKINFDKINQEPLYINSQIEYGQSSKTSPFLEMRKGVPKMIKKRGNREGSIFKIRSSGKWRAQITLQGRRLSYCGKTKTECQEWVKKQINLIDEGLTFESTQKSFKIFLFEWLNFIKQSHRWNTNKQYEQITRSYIIPYLGEMRIMEIKPEAIQNLYSTLLNKGVGVSAVRKTHTVLHSALNFALRLGIIHRNPAGVVRQPSEKQKEMIVLDVDQIQQLLMAAQDHRWKALFHLAISTGMRKAEILGLKWSDIDWNQMTVQIQRQLTRSKEKEFMFGIPKTKMGRRLVTLSPILITSLREHYNQQLLEKQVNGPEWNEYNLIFVNNVGRPIDHSNFRREFILLLKKAGLPKITFHSLRHTSASLYLTQGLPIVNLSRRLGHARPSITLDIYGHMLPSLRNDVVERIDAMITPVPITGELEKLKSGCTRVAHNFNDD